MIAPPTHEGERKTNTYTVQGETKENQASDFGDHSSQSAVRVPMVADDRDLWEEKKMEKIIWEKNQI